MVGDYIKRTHTTTTTTKKKYILKRERREIPRKVGAHRYIYSPPAVLKVFYFFILLLFIIYPPISLIVYVFRFLFQFKSLQLLSTFQFSHRFLFFVFLLMERNEHLGGLFPRWPIDKRVESQITSRLVFCYVFLSISRLHDLSQHPIQTQNSRFRVTVVRAVCIYTIPKVG